MNFTCSHNTQYICTKSTFSPIKWHPPSTPTCHLDKTTIFAKPTSRKKSSA